MSGSTYETRVVPRWGAQQIAAAQRGLGEATLPAPQAIMDSIAHDLAGVGRVLGSRTELRGGDAQLGAPVGSLTVLTEQGLRLDVDVAIPAAPQHRWDLDIATRTSPGQHAPCHVEAAANLAVHRALIAAGYARR
ncbi:MAG: hypothetical protein QM679_12565, partial [Patulibacter sp.]